MHIVTADKQKRVRIPDATPGEVFAYDKAPDGTITLHQIKKAEPAVPKCRLAKEDGFTVVIPNQPINEQAIEELLADFP